jgi:hypothetical protein
MKPVESNNLTAVEGKKFCVRYLLVRVRPVFDSAYILVPAYKRELV